MFWPLCIATLVVAVVLGIALWHVLQGVWKYVSTVVIALVAIFGGIPGNAAMVQGSETNEARAALTREGYVVVNIEAPYAFQGYDDVEKAYGQRDRRGMIDGYVNSLLSPFSTGFGYVDIPYGTPRMECATVQPDCLKVVKKPCIVRFGLWKDDRGWYLVPGTAEVVEDETLECTAMDLGTLEKKILKPRAHAIGTPEKSKRPAAPRGSRASLLFKS